ncbi:winged helix-turn-helix domain-containing protein [Acanthopleuribacter pedis]|uniref:winged helix-turn-helix domain-containing protein n=1 Tax=Acanthopleuribacter pedis TaxID=442870 RepID=UPI001A9D5209
MSETKSGRFRIGTVVADFDTNRIHGESGEIKVPPKPMALLFVLVARRGQPVSRAELIESIWEGNGYVGKRGVTDAIHRLRKVLDDRSETPRYIETIPKTGYRLLVDAVPEPKEAAPQTTDPGAAPVTTPDSAAPRRFAPWPRARQAVPVLILAMVAAILLFRADEPSRPTVDTPKPVNMVPVTYQPGIEHDAALSPDGLRLAYAWIAKRGSSRIMLLDLSQPGGTAHALNALPGLQRFPTFSADGTRLAYVRLGLPTGPIIAVVDLATGEETAYERIGLVGGRPIDWSPVDDHIAYARYDVRSGRGGIGLLDLKDGQTRWLTAAPVSHHFVDRAPAFSPTGERIAFLRSSGMGVDLFTVDAEGTTRQITRIGAEMWGLDWMPDGLSLVFAAPGKDDQGVNAALWQTDLSGTVHFLGGAPENQYFPVVHPSGASIYVYVTRPRMEINAITLGQADTAQPDPWITSTGTDQDAHYSPQRNQLVFSSTRDGGGEIWTSDPNGANPVRLTTLRRRAAFPRWSPDGSQIAFIAHDRARTLHVLDPESGTLRRLGEEGAFHVCPSWSRDGRSLYAVKQVSGSFNLWRLPVDGGVGEAVTETGGFYGQESPDGQTLYFTKSLEHGLWSKPVNGGEERLVIDWKGLNGITWLPLAEHILFLSNDADGATIQAFDLASGHSRILVKFAPEVAVAARPWSLIEATNQLLFTRSVENEGDIRRLDLDWTP